MITKIKRFIFEVVSELKKVSWSSRKEIINSTWLVIVSAGLLGLFIGLTDLMLSRLIGLVIK